MKKIVPDWFRVKRSKANSGQALLIIAISMVALIALAGLAIDGGRLLLLQRDAQNATDAAALAASFALCSGGSVTQVQHAGISAAASNGFEGDNDTVVTVRTPPEDAPPNTCADCLVEVEITREIPGYFSRIVFTGSLEVTTSAIGRCNPDSTRFGSDDSEQEPPELKSLWAGSTACNNTLKWSGATGTIVGGVHSNNDILVGGSSNNVYGDSTYVTSLDGGTDKVNWYDYGDAPGYEEDEPDLVCGVGCELYDDEYTGNPTDLADPYGTDDDPNYPVEYPIEDYRPGGRAALEASSNPNLVYAVYTCKNANDMMDMSWLKDNGYWNDATHTLKNGLYYSPCGIKINDNNLNGKVTLVAEDVIDISGSEHHIAPFIDGLLLYSNMHLSGGNKCTVPAIKMAGSTHDWTGMVFAPSGNVQMAASSNTALEGCIVAYTIDVPGSEFFINCEPGETEEEPEISILN